MSRPRPAPVTSKSATSTRASWDEQPAKASTSTTRRRAILCQPDRSDLCLEGTPIRKLDTTARRAVVSSVPILDGANMELQMRTAHANATFPDEPTVQRPGLVWHWYELICPFCYVGQDRSAVLERHGLEVEDLGFEIHPETPAAGRYIGPRHGPMFDYLEREARLAGLPLRWPDRMANSRRALAAVEWVRREQPERARLLRAALFRGYLAAQEDISDEAIILGHAAAVGVPADALAAGLRDGSAGDLLARS